MSRSTGAVAREVLLAGSAELGMAERELCPLRATRSGHDLDDVAREDIGGRQLRQRGGDLARFGEPLLTDLHIG
jgi:hypothetical protein